MPSRNLIRKCGGSLPVAVCLALLFASATLAPAPIGAASSCESLVSLALPHTTITLAEVVPPGGFVQPGARGVRGGAQGDAASGAIEPPGEGFGLAQLVCTPRQDPDWCLTISYGKKSTVGSERLGTLGKEAATAIET